MAAAVLCCFAAVLGFELVVLGRCEGAFDGAYTIVHRESGLRVFSSPQAGFSLALRHEPVYRDQLWLLADQGDERHAIVNAANGLRMVAKSGADGDSDFFVIDGGPVYQDQKWHFTVQRDGSYVISNAKSGRRLSVFADSFGPPRIAALLSAGPPLPEQAWWLINQERDASGRLTSELLAERAARAELLGAVEVLRNKTIVLANEVRTKDLEIAHISSELHHEQAEASRLTALIDALQEQLADLQEATLWNAELVQEIQAHGHRLLLLCGVALAISSLLLVSSKRGRLKLAAEVAEQRALVAQLQQDLEEDCVVQTGEVVGELGFDFGFQIINRVADGETERLVKIQCPGVSHADVRVELIFNGCDVTIQRQATRGSEAASWRKRFRFKTSDGLFEFKEDQMQLEHGFLQLVFRAYMFRSRLIRFPRHFSLAASDIDQCWEYPDYDDIGHSYEGISWLEPATPASASKPALAETSRSKSHPDTESTASTAREPN